MPVSCDLVIELGHNLGLKVVAEGVEAQTTVELLMTLGYNWLRGTFSASRSRRRNSKPGSPTTNASMSSVGRSRPAGEADSHRHGPEPDIRRRSRSGLPRSSPIA